MIKENIEIENLLLYPQCIDTVATWVYEEFGKDKPDRNLEYVINRFRN